MSNAEQELADLKKRFEALVKIVRNLDTEFRRQAQYSIDADAALRKDTDLLFRNERFIFERLYPVFNKVFPNDHKYAAEFERVLGIKFGSDDPSDRRKT